MEDGTAKTLNVQYVSRHGAYAARWNMSRDEVARFLSVLRGPAEVFNASGRRVGARELMDGTWRWWVE